MLQLHAAMKPAEWSIVITDTLMYTAYLRALKEVAYPSLQEQWTEEEDSCLRGLERSVSRMRNIDALLVARVEREFPEGTLSGLTQAYCTRMRQSAGDLNALIERIRSETATSRISIVPTSDL